MHDFTTHTDAANDDYQPLESRQKYSITLNGRVRVEEGSLAERYRAIHLKRNAAYAQFIVGEDIAIITCHLRRARVCDVNDRVTHFARDNGTWSETHVAPTPTTSERM